MFGLPIKFTKHEVMVGLNDKVTKTQLVPTIEAFKAVSSIVARYYDGASIYQGNGVYKHDDGSVVFEESLKIDIIVFDKKNDDINGLIEELKLRLNQESVAIQTSRVSSRLV